MVVQCYYLYSISTCKICYNFFLKLYFHYSETTLICLFHLQTCPSSFSFSVILGILLYMLFLQCFSAFCFPTLGCLLGILAILSNHCLLFDLSTDMLFTHTVCFLISQTRFPFNTSLNSPKWSPLSKVKGVFKSYWLISLFQIFLLYFC